MFNEEEHLYLHKLVTQKLPWTVNPFKLYQGIMQGIKPHIEQIKQEKPDLAKKILGFRPEMTPGHEAGGARRIPANVGKCILMSLRGREATEAIS